MNEKDFQELLGSVREAGRILAGKKRPSRQLDIAEPDVQAIRQSFRLSQQHFASLLGISVRTLQNWEQGHRRPRGPARVLLRVAQRHPEAVLESVRSL